MQNAIFILIFLQIFSYTQLFSKDTCPNSSKLPKKLNLRSLEKHAKKYLCQKLLRATSATKNLYANNTNLGIKKRQFLQTALYLETNLPSIQTASTHYLSKHKTKLGHSIEYDPETGNTFIILNNKKAFLGKGAKKSVYKSILYKPCPKVLARSEQSVPMKKELDAHKKLRGSVGIMKTHAFTTHKERGKNYSTIYSDLYEGTLFSLFEEKPLPFRDKLLIMNDILIGIKSIHSQGYVHRDLHAHNYLLHTQKDLNGKKKIRVVIADLGRTIPIEQAKKVPAQMTRRLCPPEGFNKKKLSGKDYFATDIYAIGCIFYRIYHNKLAPWQKEFLRSDKLSAQEKKTRLISEIKKETTKLRSSLEQKKLKRGALSVRKEIELLILQMVHPNPSKRGSAATCLKRLSGILQQADKQNKKK